MNDAVSIPEFDYPGFGRRLSEAMFPEKITAFAERVGVPQGTVSKYVRGQGTAPRLDIAAHLAKATGCTLEWLVWGQGDGVAGESDFVKIPRYDATLAAGAGSWNEGRRRLDDIPFTRDFLLKRLNRTSTAGLSVLTARGDSMAPNIADGALLLIDEADRRLTDAVFAFVLDGDARLKRFRRTLTGWTIVSDNPLYPPENISDSDLGRVQIIGRLLWVAQLVGG